MPEFPRPRRYGGAAALCLAVLGAVLAALLPAARAHAADSAVRGGRLDWGIRSSFQSYVTGPVAQGSYSLTGGAATVGDSRFRFHSARGTHDGADGSFAAAFSGGVRFLGHPDGKGGHRLDLTIANPAVRIAGGTGTLYADITGKDRGTGRVTSSAQVPFATLALGGTDLHGDGTAVVLDDVPATLTAQGARSFAGYYTAGTALDPVSLSADIVQRATPTPAPEPSTPKSPSAEPASGRALRDGAVDWGVRRTFREYVTGDIAQGAWTLSGGARDGGALFRFPAGRGTYDTGRLTARFAGAVRFTGAHGLDLGLSGVHVTVRGGTGTLFADVRTAGRRDENVPLVTFTAGRLTADGGLAVLTEAPATLTARGARAFGGLYRAGTAMDPVSLAVSLTGDAELPALPDLGSTPEPDSGPASPGPAGATPPVRPVASGSGSAADGTPALPVALTGGAFLLAALAVTYGLRRRRTRRDPAAGQPRD
ncbi:HtaA domain-containing protein [Streptomyces sp. NPDC093094]|uniref:HtaA domain-containing protein n=1 Tax=Streptomyces sp. NPDC093094 TaxID=3366026 RepID=UPI00380BD7B7